MRTAGGACAVNHGTLTAYITHGCRCDICRRNATRHNKKLRVDRLRGNPRLVDAQPIRDHVQALLEAGMSFRAISLAAGWRSRNALDEALKRDRVHTRTRDRVLAVTVASDTRRDGYVDATGARRRLQALAVNGWASRALARRLGHRDHSTVLDIQAGRIRRIRRRTADTIAGLHDELWQTPGGSDRAAAAALRRGWLPTAAWDDLDDPAETPDPAVRRTETVRRGLDPAEAADLLDLGYSVHEIAARFGVKTDSVQTALRRARRSA